LLQIRDKSVILNTEIDYPTTFVMNLPLILGVVLLFAIVVWIACVHAIEAKMKECKGNAFCFPGNVTKVVDGDTVDVNGIRIRLSLVDTPERGQANFTEAKNLASKLCPIGSTALVDQDDGQRGGSFGRMVGKVYCSYNPSNVNLTSLNEEVFKNGYAKILTEFCTKSEFASEPWVKGHGC
jgi:endonuclease YncB( thermonuclease family)